jgi:hypothetical protein
MGAAKVGTVEVSPIENGTTKAGVTEIDIARFLA